MESADNLNVSCEITKVENRYNSSLICLDTESEDETNNNKTKTGNVSSSDSSSSDSSSSDSSSSDSSSSDSSSGEQFIIDPFLKSIKKKLKKRCKRADNLAKFDGTNKLKTYIHDSIEADIDECSPAYLDKHKLHMREKTKTGTENAGTAKDTTVGKNAEKLTSLRSTMLKSWHNVSKITGESSSLNIRPLPTNKNDEELKELDELW